MGHENGGEFPGTNYYKVLRESQAQVGAGADDYP